MLFKTLGLTQPDVEDWLKDIHACIAHSPLTQYALGNSGCFIVKGSTGKWYPPDCGKALLETEAMLLSFDDSLELAIFCSGLTMFYVSVRGNMK